MEGFEICLRFQTLCCARRPAVFNAFIQGLECLLALTHLSLQASHNVFSSDGSRIVQPKEAALNSERFRQHFLRFVVMTFMAQY